MGLLREILRAGREAGPAALNTIRQQIRAGGSNLQQVEQALKTFAVTAQQEGNPLGRRILQRIDPTLQNVIDTERQTRTADAVRRMDQQRALRRAVQTGRPSPEPQWGRGQTPQPPAPEPQWGAGRRLAKEDPEMARRFRAIAESTARERGISADAVMDAMASPQGTEAPLLRELRRTYETYPSSTPAPFPAWEKNLLNAPTYPSTTAAPAPAWGMQGGRPDIPVEVSTSFSPLEGRQLSLPLRNPAGAEALVEFKTSKGAVRPAGTKLGGTSYSSAPYATSANLERIRDVSVAADSPEARQNAVMRYFANQKGDMWDLSPEAADLQVSDPQGFLTLSKIANNISTDLNLPQRDVLQALVTRDTDALKRFAETAEISPRALTLAEAPAEVSQVAADITPLISNAVGGVRQVDLRRYGLPLAAGVLGGGAGLGLVGYLASRPSNVPGSQQLTEEQLYPMPKSPQTSLTPEGIPVEGGSTNFYPPVQGGQDTTPIRSFAPPPGQMGAGSVVIRTNDQESNRRQALANAMAGAGVFQPNPEQYSSPREFYRAASAYGRQPGVAQNLQEQFAAQSPRMGQQDMQSWIAANPGLAYQLSLRNAPRDISQQTPNIQEAEIVTPLGSNTANNFVGNTSEAVKVAGGAPADLKEVTDPRLAVSLRPMPRDMQAFFNRPGFSGTSRLY